MDNMIEIEIPSGVDFSAARAAINAALAKLAKPANLAKRSEAGTVAALLATLRQVEPASDQRRKIPALERRKIPALACVRISISAGRARLECTDMEMYMSATVDMPGAPDGTWLTPVKPLIAALRTAPGASLVSIGTHSNGAVIINGAVMGGVPVSDWPEYTPGAFEIDATIPAGELGRLLSTCRHAISTEQTRYYLNGIALQSRGGRLVAVATDGHRLAMTRSSVDLEGMPDIIIPAPAVGTILAACNSGVDARVRLSDTRICVAVGLVTITSKLIDGSFPDYERVIPRDHDTFATVCATDLAEAIKRARVAAPKPLRPVSLEIAEARLTVTGCDYETGAMSNADLPADGGLQKVGFQSGYLLDLIAACASDSLEIRGTKQAPHVFRAPGDADTVFVVMPVRL